MNAFEPPQHDLLNEVYRCRECADEGRSFVSEFTEARPGFFHKFPPLIGGTGKVEVLFVGYNPRRTDNLNIHNFAMAKFRNFCALSNNVDHNGNRYIGSSPSAPDHEPHYELHDEIVQRVFGEPFENVAAVTEMYLCASEDGQLLQTKNSPCAKRFLMRTLRIADPTYIVTFGVGLPRFFGRFVRGTRADVLHLPFPSKRSTPDKTMKTALNWAVDSLIALENGQQPPVMNWTWPTNDPKLPQGIMRYL